MGLGIVAGAVLPLAVGEAAQAALPVPVETSVYPAPLLLAGAYGLLTAAVFALLPLARTRDVPPAALFRDQGAGTGPTRLGDTLVVALPAALLAGLAVAASDDRMLAAIFIAGAAAALVLFRIAGRGIMAVARAARRTGSLPLRMALANLHRPGAATPSVTVAFGIGLTVLTAVAGVQGNLRHEIGESLPQDAPAFFFIDIQPDQIEPFREIAAATDGVLPEDVEICWRVTPSTRRQPTLVERCLDGASTRPYWLTAGSAADARLLAYSLPPQAAWVAHLRREAALPTAEEVAALRAAGCGGLALPWSEALGAALADNAAASSWAVDVGVDLLDPAAATS